MLVTARTDPTIVSYAGRMSRVQPSAIRELLRLGADPDIISFGGGYPDATLFPVAELQEIYARAARARARRRPAVHDDERPAAAARPGRRAPHGRRHDVHRRRRPDHPGRPAGPRPRGQAGRRPRRRRRHREPDVPRGADRVRADRAGVRAGADRRRRDGHRAPRGGAGGQPERHDALHRAGLPEPDRRDAEPGAPAAPDRARQRVRAARGRGHAVPRAALRGRVPADAEEPRHRGPGPAPRELLQDPGAGAAARLGGGEPRDPRAPDAAQARRRHAEQHAQHERDVGVPEPLRHRRPPRARRSRSTAASAT